MRFRSPISPSLPASTSAATRINAPASILHKVVKSEATGKQHLLPLRLEVTESFQKAHVFRWLPLAVLSSSSKKRDLSEKLAREKSVRKQDEPQLAARSLSLAPSSIRGPLLCGQLRSRAPGFARTKQLQRTKTRQSLRSVAARRSAAS